MTTLRSPDGRLTAEFHPEAGMVGSSLRLDGTEVLGLRGGLSAYVERGSTFGIPLLHPWANRLSGDRYAGVTLGPAAKRDENGLPIHGLAAGLPWRLLEDGESDLEAHFDGAAIAADFPFPHTLDLRVTLDDDGLTITTTLTATTDTPVPVSFGFHPYLACDRADATVELPVRTHLLLDDRGLPTGEAVPMEPVSGPLGQTTYDDLYTDVAGPFVLRTAGRTVALTFAEGYPFAQVYAPATPADLIAIEPMTAPTNALITGDHLSHATPGDAYTARFTLRVS